MSTSSQPDPPGTPAPQSPLADTAPLKVRPAVKTGLQKTASLAGVAAQGQAAMLEDTGPRKPSRAPGDTAPVRSVRKPAAAPLQPSRGSKTTPRAVQKRRTVQEQETAAKREKELGNLVAVYHGRPLLAWDLFTWVLPGALAVLAPLAYGFQRQAYAYAKYGPALAPRWAQPWRQLSLLALLLFALLAAYRLFLAHQQVAVHKKGVRLQLRPFRPQSFTWNEIGGVSNAEFQYHFLGLTLRTTHQAVLYPNLGSPVPMPDGLQNLPELVSRLKAALYPRLHPELSANFQLGQWLYFGPLAIHSKGLRLGQAGGKDPQTNAIPWDQVESLGVRSGYLVVELKSSPSRQELRRILISKIPNLELMLQIIQQAVNL